MKAGVKAGKHKILIFRIYISKKLKELSNLLEFQILQELSRLFLGKILQKIQQDLRLLFQDISI